MAKKPKTAQRVKFQLVVPVITTAHAPSAEDFDELSKLNMVAKYEHGAFVFIGTEKPQSVVWPEWMEPIVEWFQSAYPGENWLRFDSAGDEIDGLYLYDW